MRRFFKIESSTNLNPPKFPQYYITTEITEEEFEHCDERGEDLSRVTYQAYDTDELMYAYPLPDFTVVYMYKTKEKFDEQLDRSLDLLADTVNRK